MSGAELATYRQAVLAQVSGKTLEIGFGTGLNLPYYPATVRHLTTVDVNPGMSAIAQKRLQAAQMTADQQVLNGEHLPMPDGTFDSVVSTWTLCSIANIDQALQEIHRVLKPTGRFFFVEHGLSDDPKTQVWQHRLTPIQRVIADGCHLDRDIRALVSQVFAEVEIQTSQAPGLPAVGGYFYQGSARKASLSSE
jgi:ubiquinone/menaquinone biosynthesis C-methylase UbiE